MSRSPGKRRSKPPRAPELERRLPVGVDAGWWGSSEATGWFPRGAALAAVIVTMAVYWPVLSVNARYFDDDQFIRDNRLVQNPSWSSTGTFLTEVRHPSTVRGYYKPVTMISLMIDYALGGRWDDLRQFHRTNFMLHAANTALVVLIVQALFRHSAAALLAGLLFGLHPMNVESIAWVAQRKTVLATFFGLASLLAFVRYAQRGSVRRLALVIVCYVLALLAKPTVITLVIGFVLLDYWPLRRLGRSSLLEKAPLFAMGMVFAVVTIVSQREAGSIEVHGGIISARTVALVTYNTMFYLGKLLWPASLWPYYPFPPSLAFTDRVVQLAMIGTLVCFSAVIVSWLRTRALVVGWLFYFVAIFPALGVIGFVFTVAADRFVYLPMIGLLLPIGAGFAVLWGRSSTAHRSMTVRRGIAALAALVVIGTYASRTRAQLSHWRDSIGLYEFTLARVGAAPVPRLHINLAGKLNTAGRYDEALAHCRTALRTGPGHLSARAWANAYTTLGIALANKGQTEEAVAALQSAVGADPGNLIAQDELAWQLQVLGRDEEALAHGRLALAGPPRAHNTLGVILQKLGRGDEAIEHFRQAIRLLPQAWGPHHYLANTLFETGRYSEAIQHYEAALRLNRVNPDTHFNIGVALMQQQRFPEAETHFREALRMDADYPDARRYWAEARRRQGLSPPPD